MIIRGGAFNFQMCLSLKSSLVPLSFPLKDDEIKNRWRAYFNKLFNGEDDSTTIELDDTFDDTNRRFVRRIQESEVKEALKMMKVGKALGPDNISIEAWRCLGDVGLWERVIEHRLRKVTSITKNQFGFMPGRSTTEAIFLTRQLNCFMPGRSTKNDLHMVFIDLEKAYDKVPRNVMWWALEKNKVPTK
ncbi:uncharacterized protein LOC144544079 [Carex rostrata]